VKFMKKKYIFIIIGIVFLLVLLLVGMRFIRRGYYFGQRFPRLRHWLEQREKSDFFEEPLPLLDTQGKNPLVRRIKTLTNQGGRLDWSPKGDLIAFDRLGEDSYYDIWLMKLDGSGQKCLTCNNSQLPQKHNGQPAWHPSGDYLVFQAQDPNLKGLPLILKRAEKKLTGPGIGINNNLWLMDKNGTQFWQLTKIESMMGLLHPHFSYDGKKLLWSERVSGEPKPSGQWVIKIADFVLEKNQPQIKNTKEYQPQNMPFYEVHGFTPDNQKIIFSATPDGQYQHLDIFIFNLETAELKQLTGPYEEWDEHAQLSPDGQKIVWMSSRGILQNIKQNQVITDYWIMNIDGTNKQRLTYFNDSAAPEYLKGGIAAADSSWSPEGNKLAALLLNPQTQEGPIVLIELSETR